MSARLIGGLVLAILGIGALLDQLTTFDFDRLISDWWPMLLVLVGVIQLTTRSVPVAGALVFTAFGGRKDRLTSTAFQGGTITALFGGWSNKTVTHRKDAPSAPVADANRRVLRIKAFVALGGLEVKN